MKKLYLLLICSLFSFSVFAQDNAAGQGEEEMETDRPGVGDAASVVPQGALQVELGLQFKNDETNFISDKEYQLPQALVRYGVLDFLELRLRGQLTHRVIDVTNVTLAENRSTDTGFDGFMLGAKLQLLKNDGARPAVALQADFQLPVGDETLKPDNVLPKLRLNFKNDLNDAFSLHYNLGVEWEEEFDPTTKEESDQFGLYTLGLLYKINEDFGVFAEAFGELHEDDMQQSFDLGMGYRLAPNLQLDAYGGFALSEEAPDYFISAGVSFRLPE